MCLKIISVGMYSHCTFHSLDEKRKKSQPDMHSSRESLKVKVFLAHGNLTHVPGYQALSPAISLLVPRVQMSFVGRMHPVRWYHLPAGPGLGLLSLCSPYHYHSPFSMQSTSFTKSGLLCPEGHAWTLWRPFFSPSPDPRSKVISGWSIAPQG